MKRMQIDTVNGMTLVTKTSDDGSRSCEILKDDGSVAFETDCQAEAVDVTHAMAEVRSILKRVETPGPVADLIVAAIDDELEAMKPADPEPKAERSASK